MKTSINLAKYLSVKIGHEVSIINAQKAPLCLQGASFSQQDPSAFTSQRKDDECYLLGGGNNVLIASHINKVALLGSEADFIEQISERHFCIGAATSARKLYKFCQAQDLGGAEFLAHIPGLIGGCVRGNAGLPGADMAGIFISYNDGKTLDFSYRKSSANELINSVILRLESGFDHAAAQRFALMRANQPQGASFGSCFKNPEQAKSNPSLCAGALLEKVGLKGAKFGAVGFSSKHANFLLNYGAASFDDALALILLARKRVFEAFGIMLEPEVQVFV